MYENQRNYTLDEIDSIAEQVQKGDLEIDKLVEANIVNVIHLVSKYRRSPHFEDIVQNALIAIHNCDIKKAQKPRAFLASLILDSARKTISASKCVTVSHRAKMDSESYDEVFAEFDDTISLPDFQTVDVEELQDLMGLTDTEKSMVKYRSDGYTYQEICDRMEIPESTVRHTLKHIIRHKAKELLKNEV